MRLPRAYAGVRKEVDESSANLADAKVKDTAAATTPEDEGEVTEKALAGARRS